SCRPEIFAYRPAPIQVNYLGYPGTMGADFMDYVLGDRIVLPMDEQPHYAERIVQLPDTFQVNDSKRKIAQRRPTREEAGLPERAFVFCCFNNSYKISASMFDIWMRMLHGVDDSVLWLAQTSSEAADNLRSAAVEHGVDPSRLIFAPKVPHL